MTATLSRRLPGFRFEAPPAARTDVLPRMDIAVFVGFAASGPLNTPVPVEDEAQFSEIFGRDAFLAWDEELAEPIYAYLAPAVRAFFRNGGRRCWIVRVAGSTAQATEFPVPGLVGITFKENGENSLTPATARARSAGRWSDGLGVSAGLMSQPIEVLSVLPRDRTARLALDSANDVIEGDLLRFHYREQGLVAIFPADSLKVIPPSEDLNSPPIVALPFGRHVEVRGTHAVFLLAAEMRKPTEAMAQVQGFDSRSGEGAISAFIPRKAPANASPPSELDWPAPNSGAPAKLDLAVSIDQAPILGSLLKVIIGDQELWLTVEQLSVGESYNSPPQATVRVTGAGWWRLQEFPVVTASPPNEPPQPDGEKLSFEFWIRYDEQKPARLSGLGFAPRHRRFWGALPTDEELYAEAGTETHAAQSPLWREAASPRFPLAGWKGNEAFFFPLNMPLQPEHFARAVKPGASGLARDGLKDFASELFLDSRLSDVGLERFVAEADFVRYQIPNAKPLKGIHAALAIEEATIIAVPDAVHRDWSPEPEKPLAVEPSSPLERPEWWHFLKCDPPPAIPRTSDPSWGHFLDCDAKVIRPPEFIKIGELKPTGAYTIAWVPQDLAVEAMKFVLEEANHTDFGDAVEIYSGTETVTQIFGRAPGEYFYRVRAVKGRATSDWSEIIGVRVTAGERWSAKPRSKYSPATLLAVQRALLRLCGARADLLAVLALPDHYRDQDAVIHAESLKPFGPGSPRPSGSSSGLFVPPLSFGEVAALGFGAVYHPWMLSQTPELEFRRTPPDGTACGVLARRALDRGAWIAPANELWRGVAALTPTISPDHWDALQQAQVNLLRQEPRGFLTLSADTLSADADLRPIHVRRLLMLLRRLALKLGATYVFEPNDGAFRRLVERNFEALLEDLFRRGAFAGKTAASSFQVVTSDTVNTTQSMEQGRFIVELRVAPAQPLTFVTIRLMQTGNGNFAVVQG